jgi:hypothetical protein
MRMRLLLRDTACSVCKVPQDQVYVFSAPDQVRPWAGLQIWGENAGPGVVFDDVARMFMPKDFHKDVFTPIKSPWCTETGCG